MLCPCKRSEILPTKSPCFRTCFLVSWNALVSVLAFGHSMTIRWRHSRQWSINWMNWFSEDYRSRSVSFSVLLSWQNVSVSLLSHWQDHLASTHKSYQRLHIVAHRKNHIHIISHSFLFYILTLILLHSGTNSRQPSFGFGDLDTNQHFCCSTISQSILRHDSHNSPKLCCL